MTEELNKTKNTTDDEIDLIALAKTIWNGRKSIVKIVLLFMGIGLAVALLSPKKYNATTTMVPQVSDGTSSMGGISSLAAMAGFNMNMGKGNTELSPHVYPQIVQSVPFQLELMNTPFTFSNINHPISIYEYYTEYHTPSLLSNIKKYTIGLPSVILKAIKPKKEKRLPITDGNNQNSPIFLTRIQEDIRIILAKGITLETNDKEGYITLNVTSKEPWLAAEIANKGQELLQKYITTYKIEKASAQLKFIEERYNDNKLEFEEAQAALADFRDKNKNITSARALTHEESLESEYQLAFDVYSELAKQMEQARIKVKEDTPVFSIIKPVTVPLEKSAPNRPMILIIWTFLGGIVAIGWILGKEFLVTIKKRWQEEL